jgi:hypothetical protein
MVTRVVAVLLAIIAKKIFKIKDFQQIAFVFIVYLILNI